MCTGYKTIVLWGLDIMADFGWFLCAVYTLLLWRAIPQLALELSCIFTLSPCANCGITCSKEANLPIYSFGAKFTSHFKFPIWTYVFSFCHRGRSCFLLVDWIFWPMGQRNTVGHHADPQIQLAQRSQAKAWILLPSFEVCINLELNHVFCLLYIYIYIYITYLFCFWLHSVFIALRGFSLVAGCRNYSSCSAWVSHCHGFYCWAQSLGHGLQQLRSTDSVVAAQGL